MFIVQLKFSSNKGSAGQLMDGHKTWIQRGFDAEGGIVDREVDGFHARLVQHECDHLDGILYPQRITDMRQFGFEEELFDEPPEVEDAC